MATAPAGGVTLWGVLLLGWYKREEFAFLALPYFRKLFSPMLIKWQGSLAYHV